MRKDGDEFGEVDAGIWPAFFIITLAFEKRHRFEFVTLVPYTRADVGITRCTHGGSVTLMSGEALDAGWHSFRIFAAGVATI